MEYFLLFYGRINMAVLNYIGIKSSHAPFTRYNKKFDRLFIKLIGVKYIHLSLTHPLTHPLTHSSIDPLITYSDAPTKRYFFYKKITQK